MDITGCNVLAAIFPFGRGRCLDCPTSFCLGPGMVGLFTQTHRQSLFICSQCSLGIGDQKIHRLLHEILWLNFAHSLKELLLFHYNDLQLLYTILLLLQFLMKTLFVFETRVVWSKWGARGVMGRSTWPVRSASFRPLCQVSHGFSAE